MDIKTGVDIVYLPRFRKSLKSGGSKFLQRVYMPQELKEQKTTRLAGVFAAKEAVIKALGLPPGSWRDIQITHKVTGAPNAKILDSRFEILNSSLSISHDGNYVVAIFVAIYEPKKSG